MTKMEIFKKKYQKSMKIISVISEFKDLSKSGILDIGCGTGIITENLGKICKKVIGVDVENKRLIKEGYKFKLIKNEKLPFKDNTFDVVISNQIIEHVSNQEEHIKEIYRVLRNKGICYLATPNKYWPIEPHYHLPFLGILPKGLANFYLKIFWNKNYNIKLLSYTQLINKLKKYFIINDFTFKVIKNPIEYHLEKKYKIIPNFLIRILNINIVPSFILILKKK